MPDIVAILEDDPGRVVAMRACLAEALPATPIAFFEDAHEMIAWLGEHLGEVVLISLDHDLPLRDVDGQAIDCGTGRQVADFLAGVPPTCPVIVHSSNATCAPGMFYALKNAGWPCRRVYPLPDQDWIPTAWADEVRHYVRAGWITTDDRTQPRTTND